MQTLLHGEPNPGEDLTTKDQKQIISENVEGAFHCDKQYPKAGRGRARVGRAGRPREHEGLSCQPGHAVRCTGGGRTRKTGTHTQQTDTPTQRATAAHGRCSGTMLPPIWPTICSPPVVRNLLEVNFTEDSPGGRGYVATLPTCGPLLILPPALKRWGPPRRQGLCSHPAHLWATSDSFSRFEVLGTLWAAGVM